MHQCSLRIPIHKPYAYFITRNVPSNIQGTMHAKLHTIFSEQTYHQSNAWWDNHPLLTKNKSILSTRMCVLSFNYLSFNSQFNFLHLQYSFNNPNAHLQYLHINHNNACENKLYIYTYLTFTCFSNRNAFNKPRNIKKVQKSGFLF